jgi:hypothetical protein
MKKPARRSQDRKLALRRETLRALSSLRPEQIARVAGGADPIQGRSAKCQSLGWTSKFCET